MPDDRRTNAATGLVAKICIEIIQRATGPVRQPACSAASAQAARLNRCAGDPTFACSARDLAWRGSICIQHRIDQFAVRGVVSWDPFQRPAAFGHGRIQLAHPISVHPPAHPWASADCGVSSTGSFLAQDDRRIEIPQSPRAQVRPAAGKPWYGGIQRHHPPQRGNAAG